MEDKYGFDYEYDIKSENGMNVTENKLYNSMLRLGLDPHPQYKIDKMTVDFAFPSEKIVVEVNGPYHNSVEQKKVDKARWFVLNKFGWKRISYDASAVYNNPDNYALKIYKRLTSGKLGKKDLSFGDDDISDYAIHIEKNNDANKGTSIKKNKRRNIIFVSILILAIILLSFFINKIQSNHDEEILKNKPEYEICKVLCDGECSTLHKSGNVLEMGCNGGEEITFNYETGEIVEHEPRISKDYEKNCTEVCESIGSEIDKTSGAYYGRGYLYQYFESQNASYLTCLCSNGQMFIERLE